MTLRTFGVLAGCLVVGGVVGVASADKVDFGKQVQPLLAATCYKCHAGDKHKGDLKLDSLEAFQKGGKDGKVIEPGNPDKSELFKRVTLKPDDDDVMPPNGKGDHLKTDQSDLIKQWIAEGASFGDWKAAAPIVAGAGDKAGDKPAADEGPKEIPLPTVPPADPAAVAKLQQAGGQVLPLAVGTNLLAVEFASTASQVNNDTVALLAPFAAQVYELNLANTKVTDDGLKPLEGMKNLHRLHLEKTAITDAGLVHLKDLTSLEYLNLYNTQVSDAGLAPLQGLKGLKQLYLWQSKVTDAGADNLKKALPALALNMGWKEPAPATTQAKEPGK